MLSVSIVSEKFVSRVSMPKLVERYGFKVNSQGYMACPFHKDDTPSLRVYDKTGEGFYCFGCNKGGSVITFVMELFKLSYPDALKKLDSDFNLNILEEKEDRSLSRMYNNDAAIKKIQAKRKRTTLDAMIKQYCTYHLAIKFDEPMSDTFCEALYRITDLEYKIECEEEGVAINGYIHT